VSGLQLVHIRKDPAMLLHLIGTQQFGSKGQFINRILLYRVASAQTRPYTEKVSANGLGAYIHI
jgi:hypothetical protein